MAAPKGNEFWKMRAKHGRDKIFKTPEALWEAACEYFQWVEDHPLQEEKLFHYQGEIIKENVSKIRAMTLDGLSMFLHVDKQTWLEYAKRKDFFGVVRMVETTIRDQKFTGAAADLLNANIIARDLGLRDGNIISGDPDNPVQTVRMSTAEYKEARKEMLDGDDC